MGRIRLRRAEQSWWIRTLLGGYEWAASLEVAVVLISLSAAVLGWATFVEKWYGTEAVSFGLYRSWWFMGLVSLLGLNVLCAALIRWPWKKHQTGFVITHTGILVLLVGCLVQQGWGIQGQMILHEGEASSIVYEDQKLFRLAISEGAETAGASEHQAVKTVEVPFRSGPFTWSDYSRLPFFPWRIVPRDQGRIYDQDGITLEVLDYYADSERVEAPRLVLDLRWVGQDATGGLVEGPSRLKLTVARPTGPHAGLRPFGVGDRQNMPWGPLVVFWLAGSQAECDAFLASRPEGPVGSLGQVVLWHGGQVYRFPVEQLQNRPEQPLGRTGLKVVFVRYEERFRAVELQVQSEQQSENRASARMLLFAQNPSHDRQAEALGVYGSYWVEPPPVPDRLAGIERVELLRLAAALRLDILLGPDGKLSYRQWQAPKVVAAGLWPGFGEKQTAPFPGSTAPAGENPGSEAEMGKPYPVEQVPPLRVFADTALATEVRLAEFRPASQPTVLYEPKSLGTPSEGRQRQPLAKVRLTVQERPFSDFPAPAGSESSATEANTGEFWIPLGGPRYADEQAIVSSGNRRVELTLDYRKWELGIQIYLRDFTRKVDPGALHDAHYSSLVDVLEGKDPPQVRQEKTLITMNQPLTAKDPKTGRTYRFYQASFSYLGKPGDPEFERWIQTRAIRRQDSGEGPGGAGSAERELAAGSIPEDLYQSVLSVNYDPGRGLKYAGSLLIVAGIGLMYAMRAYIFAPRGIQQAGAAAMILVVWGLLLGAEPAKAEDLDWTQWRRLPVFAGGRRMPLDSFARAMVERICGRSRPRLSLADALPGEDLNRPEYAEAQKLFPDGQSRTWEPYELIFSWLVEPDRWQRTPFLVGQHHQLREEILGLPRETPSGQPIKYVSPWQVEQAAGFWRWQQDVRRRRQEAERAGKKFTPTGVDRKGWQLLEAYSAWRNLVFSAQDLGDPQSLFQARLSELHDIWLTADQAIKQALQMNDGPRQAYGQFQEALESLQDLLPQRPIDRQRMERESCRLRQAAQQLADWFEGSYSRLRRSPPPMPPEDWRQMEGHWAALVSRTRDLWRMAWEVQTALFENSLVGGGGGEPLRLVPSLNPFALEEARTPEENPQPWLAWQMLFEASLTETLADYPAAEIQAVRKAFQEAAHAYQDRSSPDRAERFSTAMKNLTDTLRRLGETIHQKREKLPVRKLDSQALQATQYPPPGAMDLEVHYNQTDPFRAAWIGYLLAAAVFALSFGRMRKPMFWLGMVFLGVAQFFILYGLALRYAITGWVPVTNMFETVVFVALTVAAMGWVLALWPLWGPGLRIAWQLTAWPISWRSPEQAENIPASFPKSSHKDQDASGEGFSGSYGAAPRADNLLPVLTPQTIRLWRWIWTPVRMVLMGMVFYGLTQVHYGEGEGYTVISLTPRVERGGSLTANDAAAWLTGWAFLVGSMWYAPRAVLAALASLWTAPLVWRRRGLREAGQQVLDRKAYAFSGAVMGLVGALLAYYAPPTVLDKSIGSLRPVLRDNFWLTAHVLTITASYGAGALALALGNLALFHYLFGRYQAPKPHTDSSEPSTSPSVPARREPPACQRLAHSIYRSMQVAVLLLAAGTILGALWADVAWGRFWGWDAKEVWALISLLVYMVVLHGRYIGWFGNFGLAAFSVLGATSILMAWYGVNYVLDVGLHSYGRGAGGLEIVLGVVAANWLFLAAAAVRYYLETRSRKQPTP